MTDKFDIIEQVSNTIIERLEDFTGEWEKPFISSFARNVSTKKAYRGINILILNFAALFNGFSSSVWGTYRQWQEKGYQVKKGSKATTIVFWKPLSYKCEVENTETGFVSTLAHETVHATGHKNRLNRDMKGRFGNESYAFEELIADIGAGFVAGYLGYDYQFSKNNLAYLKSWLKVLKNDKRAIFKACSEAQKAFDYLLTFQEIGREAA